MVENALSGDKWALAKLVSLFEDSRKEIRETRIQVMRAIGSSEKRGKRRQAHLFGFTGAPGSGKSTLIGEIARRLLELQKEKRVAILAVDPSSQASGGSLLGDRTRIAPQTNNQRLFIRSQAAGQQPGAISRHTFSATRLLRHFCDYLLIETVGSGQSEVEIGDFADHLFLLLQPLAGDQLQFMKAGIMEMPDLFILNKCDNEDIARNSLYALRESLSFVQPGEDRPILAASARSGQGLSDLTQTLLKMALQPLKKSQAEKEASYLHKWIKDQFGWLGIEHLQQQFQADPLQIAGSILEERQTNFENSLLEKLHGNGKT